MQIRAISVNPVDAKMRAGGGAGNPDGAFKVLRCDTAGVVAAVGSEVTPFSPGAKGVGSIATQLARRFIGLTIIAPAADRKPGLGA